MNNYYKLIKVEPDANNNKLYILERVSSGWKASWGRVGSSMQSLMYADSQGKLRLSEKLRKGYVDITFESASKEFEIKHNDKNVENLFKSLIKNTKGFIKDNFEIQNFTKAQIQEAQNILNSLIKLKDEKYIKELLKVIPRPIPKVKEYIDLQLSRIDSFISEEQDRIDSCTSSIIIEDTSNIFEDLNIEISSATKEEEAIVQKILDNGRDRSCKIINIFRVTKKDTQNKFDNWVLNAKNKETSLLIHGTRIENTISILNSELLIRPSNAVYSGSAYGDGIYHSLHMKKSLGYTGYSNEKIMLIQNVHTGKMYEYDGWYRQGKSIDRSQMNYNGFQKLGYDSLYVKPGDGLLNSEYIVYNSDQTTCNYIIYLKT